MTLGMTAGIIETATAKIFTDASQNLKLLSAYSCVTKRTRKHQRAYPVYVGHVGHGRIRNIFRNSQYRNSQYRAQFTVKNWDRF